MSFVEEWVAGWGHVAWTVEPRPTMADKGGKVSRLAMGIECRAAAQVRFERRCRTGAIEQPPYAICVEPGPCQAVGKADPGWGEAVSAGVTGPPQRHIVPEFAGCLHLFEFGEEAGSEVATTTVAAAVDADEQVPVVGVTGGEGTELPRSGVGDGEREVVVGNVGLDTSVTSEAAGVVEVRRQDDDPRQIMVATAGWTDAQNAGGVDLDRSGLAGQGRVVLDVGGPWRR